MYENPRLTELLKKKAQLEARIERETALARQKSRKLDTRHKIILGACILADIAKHPEGGTVIEDMLRRAASLPRDRELLRSQGWKI